MFLPQDPYAADDGRIEANIVGSRGCPYDCGFCGAAVSANPDIKIRTRSPEGVIAELETLHAEHGATAFRFVDDLFLGAARVIRPAMEAFTAHRRGPQGPHDDRPSARPRTGHTHPRAAANLRRTSPANFTGHYHGAHHMEHLWPTIDRLVQWLDTETETTPEVARLLRVLKISEEAGEVAEAIHGVSRSNPRKGASHTCYL